MNHDELAQVLSDPKRIGLTPENAAKLKLASADVTRGQLLAQMEGNLSYLGVYLLGAYVIDDTDFFGSGQIYWWSIPAMVDKSGKVAWSPLHGLPTGAAPHKVGSNEWMTNFALDAPPLLALIPPTEEVGACVLRVGFYDDDGAVANVPKAIADGLGALASISQNPLQGVENVLSPVREAIWKSLRAEQDDILIDQDVTLRRGEHTRFNVGIVRSESNEMVRVYLIVKDEEKTEQCGPFMLHKRQTETIKFKQPMKRGGRLAIFARGADVECSALGELTTDTPFINRVLDAHGEATLEKGFPVTARGPAKLVAFYTPPV
jgi:hypothetical protein